MIMINCEEKKYSLQLPQFTDVFGKKASVEMNLDAVFDFLEFDSNKLTTTVQSPELCDQVDRLGRLFKRVWFRYLRHEEGLKESRSRIYVRAGIQIAAPETEN
jgi:hypothetical protein